MVITNHETGSVLLKILEFLLEETDLEWRFPVSQYDKNPEGIVCDEYGFRIYFCEDGLTVEVEDDPGRNINNIGDLVAYCNNRYNNCSFLDLSMKELEVVTEA